MGTVHEIKQNIKGTSIKKQNMNAIGLTSKFTATTLQNYNQTKISSCMPKTAVSPIFKAPQLDLQGGKDNYYSVIII